MSNTYTMPIYRVIKKLRIAESCAFIFVNLEKTMKSWASKREKTVEHIGGKISPFWVFMSIIGILAAIGCGIFAAFNAQTAIAGIIDPMGNGTLPAWLYLVIGASISIVGGMLFGHFIFEGLTEGFKTDVHTGIKTPTSKIWLAVVGFIGAIFYLVFQFSLVKNASNGNTSMSYLPYVVVGIGIIELVIGAMILHKAFAYLLLFFISLAIAITSKQLNNNARFAHDNYMDYLTFLKVYNNENPINHMETEGNENIRRAVTFYRSPNPSENNPDNANPETKRQENANSAEQKNSGINNDSAPNPGKKSTGQKDHEQPNMESFMDDTTDENITA